MKIAVTATGGSLTAQVDPRFGRCAYFIIVDSETMKFTAFSNPATQTAGGAGPAATHEISKYKVKVLLTGEVGVNAQKALDAAGIKVVTGVTGTVREAVQRFSASQQQSSS